MRRTAVASLVFALAACGGDSSGPPANNPPTVTAGTDQDVNRGAMVTLIGITTDPEGAALTVSWTQTSGVSVGALTGASPTFTAPNAILTLEFEIHVSDGEHEVTDRVAVRVLEDKDHALWVAPTGNNGNAGTRGAPKATIQGAIDASTNGADVYAAAGTYAGTVTLKNGVSVYGGYNGTTWLRDVAANVSTISGGPTAVQGSGVSGLTLDGLTIRAANATGNGASSIAVLLTSGSDVVISGNQIGAGNGSDGTDRGKAPTATAGSPGEAGKNGCTDPPPSEPSGCGADGGLGGSGAWFGGLGGPGNYLNGYLGGPGQGPDYGAAGTQGLQSPPTAGGPGGPGGPGGTGLNGFSGLDLGTFSGGVYLPSHGLNGGEGGRGSGGGGGGGGWGTEIFITGDIILEYGGGGGGGGGGGFGGAGGPRGDGGGGSFGIILSDSSGATLLDNTITTGSGGMGGDGGAGGDGGDGGAGGPAGLHLTPGQGDGGPGGAGGRGGDGGGGGGGGGGPSIGLIEAAAATSNVTDVNQAGNSFTLGTAGAGGNHGTLGVGAGAAGRQANRLKL